MLQRQLTGIPKIVTFPGQGRLIPPALLKELAPAHRRSKIPIPHKLAQSLFDDATPKEYFMRSSYLQPSIVYTSLLLVELLEQRRGQPLEATYTMGHSLGELTTLVLNGVIPRDAAVEVAHRRGLFMEGAVDRQKKYGMFAYIFKEGSYEFIQEAVKKWDSLGVANSNITTQCVVSGEVKELKEFTEYVKSEVRAKATQLDVKLPFHNKQLHEAEDKFRELMKQFNIDASKELSVPIVSNLTGEITLTHGEALENFILDFSRTVNFVKCMQTVMGRHEKVQFLNVGPNARVIQGIAKKMDKEKRIVANDPLETLEDIDRCK